MLVMTVGLVLPCTSLVRSLIDEISLEVLMIDRDSISKSPPRFRA